MIINMGKDHKMQKQKKQIKNIKKDVIIKFKTPAYNADSTLESTNKSTVGKVFHLTQMRIFSDLQGKNIEISSEKYPNARLLTQLSGNGYEKGSGKTPPYQNGRYILMFDEFTSITFNTGFNSNYDYGTYKYTGNVHGMGKYKFAEIEWLSQASGNKETDEWTIKLIE